MRYLILFLTISSLCFAGSPKNFSRIEKILQVTDLDAEIAQDFFKGGCPDTALECKKGIKLPLKILANLDYFSLTFIPNLTVTIEKDCYIRFCGKKGYVSYDLIHWEKAKKLVKGMPVTKFRVNQENSQIEIDTKYVDPKLPKFEY